MFSRSQSDAFVSLRQHDEYYISGGDLFFLVKQYHFRVHRYFFERESPFFKAKLASPASPGEPRQGTSETTAIVLDDVTPEDFSRFLWVFYNPKYSLYDASADDWTAILKLSEMWRFSEVKALAVRELEHLELDDIERICVYHSYNVDRTLLVPRYAALCQRQEMLTLEEGFKLGMETTLNIVRARELARGSATPSGLRSPSPSSLDTNEVRSLVCELFGIQNGGSVTSPTQAQLPLSPRAQPLSPRAQPPPPPFAPEPIPATPTFASFANGAAAAPEPEPAPETTPTAQTGDDTTSTPAPTATTDFFADSFGANGAAETPVDKSKDAEDETGSVFGDNDSNWGSAGKKKRGKKGGK